MATVYGSGGNDHVDWGIAYSTNTFTTNGIDHIYIHGGNDYAHGAGGHDTIYGGAGHDWLYGGDGGDLIWGEDGNDIIYGGNDADRLRGGNGNDNIWGEAGNDDLDGGAGNDTLNGGAGNDELTGSWGKDIMTGGPGADKFSFVHENDTANYATGNADIIKDFRWGEGDKIYISDGLVDEFIGYSAIPAVNQASYWHLNGKHYGYIQQRLWLQ